MLYICMFEVAGPGYRAHTHAHARPGVHSTALLRRHQAARLHGDLNAIFMSENTDTDMNENCSDQVNIESLETRSICLPTQCCAAFSKAPEGTMHTAA